jgi:hypothetical protein
MQLDDLRGCHTVRCAYIREVGAVDSAVAHRNFYLTRLGQSYVFQACKILPQSFFELFVPVLERIELDQHGAIRGMEVADAFDGFCLEKTQQFSDAFVSVERNVLAEVNEKRLIAGAQELRKGGCGGGHGGKSIPLEAYRVSACRTRLRRL